MRSERIALACNLEEFAADGDKAQRDEAALFIGRHAHGSTGLLRSTVNPAKALGKPHVLGRIRANYFADMIAIPFEDSRKSLYEALSSYDGVIGWLMIGGQAAKL